MATDKEIDAQFEQTILDALHTMSTGMITIIKLNHQVVQVNIDENYNSSSPEVKRQRGHLTLISDKDAG
jgi:hypothetical protein